MIIAVALYLIWRKSCPFCTTWKICNQYNGLCSWRLRLGAGSAPGLHLGACGKSALDRPARRARNRRQPHKGRQRSFASASCSREKAFRRWAPHVDVLQEVNLVVLSEPHFGGFSRTPR